MPVDRPTFSESWYRISDLMPKLPGAVRVSRQHYRGGKWYVIQGPSGHQFFRLSDAAYHFVGMLDGRRTVREVWLHCVKTRGDAAPTQGEVLDLLSGLHASNLLQADLAPDAEQLFKRHQKSEQRNVRGLITNLLSIRVPLWRPNNFLDRWVFLFGPLFSWLGLLAWAAIIATGFISLAGYGAELERQSSGVLNPANLPLLYAALVVVKLFHEMGHAFSCKHFGKHTASGGEVYQMGVMFLVFTPLPYVDASGAWALRSKLQRVVVGAGGMLVELAMASIAAILWVHTADGSTLHAIAYNIMFIAGVSSLIFNANPFLRYDAYFVLMDLLDIPNLDSRSRLYFSYLVKRYAWGLEKAHDPSHTPEEKGWLFFYAVASTICRAVVYFAIIMYLGQSFFAIGAVVAGVIFAGMVLVNLGRLVNYLLASPELSRRRQRACLTTSATALVFMMFFAFVSIPDRFRIEGVVEPMEYSVIHMETDGFVQSFLPSGSQTGPEGPPLIKASSLELETKRAALTADLRQLRVKRQSAQTIEAVQVQIMEDKIAALKEQIERVDREIAGLTIRSPVTGTWVSPHIDWSMGRYFPRGHRIGIVANLSSLRIRAVAGQDAAGQLIREAKPVVEVRAKNQPDFELSGQIERIIPSGQEQLPSAALGYSAGGSTQVDLKDPSGRRTAEPFFEILVSIPGQYSDRVLPGQSMVLKFETSSKSLLDQGWRAMLQLFQRRFQI